MREFDGGTKALASNISTLGTFSSAIIRKRPPSESRTSVVNRKEDGSFGRGINRSGGNWREKNRRESLEEYYTVGER